MSISSSRLFQLFKYAVYALLAFNIVQFWWGESLAAPLRFSNGVPLADLIEAYAATIDTAAWVVLLLMFELETYVLEDRHYNALVTWTLQGIRVVCYTLIVYALYGYIVILGSVHQVVAFTGVNDLCTLVSDGWSYAVDLGEFTQLTTANCGSFSSADAFFKFAGMSAVVDADGITQIRYLAWVDVINASVWLLVVLILEFDVWLQERNRFEGAALAASNVIKAVLYPILLLAAIYWGVFGSFVDFWDAFLWLVAFVFIELNVFEWRQEIKEAVTQGDTPASS